MWLSQGPLAHDEITRRFWWRCHRRELVGWGLALAVAIGVALWALLKIDERSECQSRPFECNLVTEVVGTLGVAAVGALFFVWKLRRIVRDFAELARNRPEALLGVEMPHEVAGAPLYEDFFNMIARDLLREQPSRVKEGKPGEARPVQGKLITAGAGAGKTTAMVNLAAFLASRQVIPVPISLRSQTEPVNLVQLARQQFSGWVDTRTPFGDQGDRVFAHLRSRGQVVILADGLDEALPGVSRSQRGLALNAAIQDALESKVAVIATWRTADLGKDLPLSRFPLPQLEERDAVKFLCQGAAAANLADAIAAAQLHETPFYLTIARPLVAAGRLDKWAGEDMFELRVELLDRYTEALCDGTVVPEADIPSDSPGGGHERADAIDQVSALAMGMLARGRASVPLEQVEECATDPLLLGRRDVLDVHSLVDSGRSLRLFELVGQETVQFTHSVMQAYLASRVVREQFRLAGPLLRQTVTHELRTAFVMAAAWRKPEESERDRQDRARHIATYLIEATSQSSDRGALGLLATASKVAAAADLRGELGDRIVERARGPWRKADPLPKLEAISALCALGAGRAYDLMLLALDDTDFRVARAGAKAIGNGGNLAYDRLQPSLAKAIAGATRRRGQARLDNIAYVMPLLRQAGNPGYVPELKDLVGLIGTALSATGEGSLARGFKRDARLRPKNAVDQEVVETALDRSRWWYAKLCLLHALTLRADAGAIDPLRTRLTRHADDQNEHPFVREGALQCFYALADPAGVERWIWRDESRVVMRARPTRPRAALSDHDLEVLAVQLAADVALAINLTFSMEPNAAWTERERRAERDRRTDEWLSHAGLPHCIGRSSDRREVFPPNGRCPPDCEHNFCPLRWDAAGSFWNEFSEAFCRQQQERLPRAAYLASWQRGVRRRRGLRRFWDQMANEARRTAATRAPGH
jgi:hypothetical protein